MNTLFWIIISSSVISLIKPVIAEEMTVHFDEFVLTYWKPDIFERADCQLFQKDNRSYVNGEFVFKRNVGEFSVRTAMDFWKPNNQKMKIYDVRFDGCLLLRTAHKNRLFNIYVKSFRKHANANLICPFKANFSYTLTNWQLETQDLPSFIPVGRFRTITEYFTQKQLGARFVTQGKFIAKN
ncbi:uncharacterized protein LOC117901105 [Drosophila subobscura]|uniref:uncharacterized protein LOC117901105 n=1 Tax=Drosophila subobscura TaxID=7241 RepID=UPI00155B15B5|nr:uncharacterized protein LOC117901105 [Drosophila subobscura]